MTGRRLRKLREKSKLSQLKLSDELNVSQATVGRWERGLMEVPEDMKKKLSEVFNVAYAPPKGAPLRKISNQKAERVAIMRRMDNKAKFWRLLPEDDEDLLALRKLMGI